MTGRLPDFVIAGAPRSGTTWLRSALERHPRIWMAKPVVPEPKFFLVDDLYTQGIEEYSRRWFSDVPAGCAAGEKSTNYLESAQAAERMAAHLPDVRLIFVLREPIARAISNYRWSVMNGMETEDFATAIALEEEREANVDPRLRFARPHAYVSRGRYARLLQPWFKLFDRDQILVVRFEDLAASPGDTLAKIHAHLGVDPRPDLGGDASALNRSVGDQVAIDPKTRARLEAEFAPLNRELGDLLGPDFTPWTYKEVT
ncbi:MAG TPA: sulfotransferase [Actinopolymorphaceae bacterium]